mmetsp:Transcript_13337/g.30416  ORF Transcript_13337/g.30416 Transcript_13337/m.30416 type:complete len:222 (+) Transcript_13337:624-1289(+)
MLAGLCCHWPRFPRLLQHRLDQVVHLTPWRQSLPIWLASLREPHHVIDAGRFLCEQAWHTIVSSWNIPRKQLKEDDAHAEDIPPWVPNCILPRLRWNVPWCPLHTHGVGAETNCQPKVNQDNLGRFKAVVVLHHDVGLFDVTMHDGIAMQECQTIQALCKDPPPPTLRHVSPTSSVVPYCRQVASKVWLVDKVKIAVILEDFKRLGNVIVLQHMHDCEFLL